MIEDNKTREIFKSQLLKSSQKHLVCPDEWGDWLTISAKKALVFFNELILLKNEYPDLEISTDEFNALLTSLLTKKYLSKIQMSNYQKTIQTCVPLNILRTQCIRNTNVNGMIDIKLKKTNWRCLLTV